jgi:hypothetical protein
MAKVAFSAIVSDLRNKIGGNVFTKVRSGAMVRIKVSPTQPRTAAQQTVRSSFTAFSKAWDTITEVQRDGWRSLAAGLPQKDIFGNTYYLTGIQLFQLANRNLASIGVAQISDAPASLSVGSPGTLTLVANHTGPVLTIDAVTEPAAGEVPLIFATRPLNAGRLFVGNNRQILDAAIVAGTAGPWDVATLYAAKYGALAAGQNLNFGVRYINNTTGAGSLMSVVQGFVA